MDLRKGREREERTFQTQEQPGLIHGHRLGRGQVVDTGDRTRRQVLGTGGGKWCGVEAISVGDTQTVRCCTMQEKEVLALIWMAVSALGHIVPTGDGKWARAAEPPRGKRS